MSYILTPRRSKLSRSACASNASPRASFRRTTSSPLRVCALNPGQAGQSASSPSTGNQFFFPERRRGRPRHDTCQKKWVCKRSSSFYLGDRSFQREQPERPPYARSLPQLRRRPRHKIGPHCARWETLLRVGAPGRALILPGCRYFRRRRVFIRPPPAMTPSYSSDSFLLMTILGEPRSAVTVSATWPASHNRILFLVVN